MLNLLPTCSLISHNHMPSGDSPFLKMLPSSPGLKVGSMLEIEVGRGLGLSLGVGLKGTVLTTELEPVGLTSTNDV